MPGAVHVLPPTGTGDAPLGDDLANSLGLTQVSSVGVTGCYYFAESQPGRGYCLDGVVDNDHDANMLSIQIGGRGLAVGLGSTVMPSQR